ncbi:hypothetical protein PCASD_15455 [Puccinia coronata f. sp. avenae]|uniref:CCHC-type domain-containing protein n=1 Tax=Puccinia coronata f. sp. avenae TaxID=200324 RepID=A0A2N5UPJ0_9BASI|nr:hypothetical protein PCASD_15455 [Puccinia coronata f. sp. avenae]
MAVVYSKDQRTLKDIRHQNPNHTAKDLHRDPKLNLDQQSQPRTLSPDQHHYPALTPHLLVTELHKTTTKASSGKKLKRNTSQQRKRDAQPAKAKLEAERKPDHALEPSHKGPKIAVPDKFDGTRGTKAEVYANQIGLYVVSNGHLFPDNRSRIVFLLSYLTGPASAWAQPFTQQVFSGKDVSYKKFSTAFQAMYFNTEKKSRAEKALGALRQTKTVAHYTHTFTIHAHDLGWEQRTLVSQFTQGLKRDVRLALVLARTEFDTLAAVSQLGLKIDNEINSADAAPTATTPSTNPNTMDLSALNGCLSELERSRMLSMGLCFCCGEQGHLARACPTKGSQPGKGQQRVRIDALKEDIKRLTEEIAKATTGNRAEGPKNGGTQEAYNCPSATPNPKAPTFLIDSGATHDVLSEDYAQTAGLMKHAIQANRQISGFNGSKSQSCFEINLRLEESDALPHQFIITKLKDFYDGILGMPWMTTHGHSIDWKNQQFQPEHNQPSIATTAVVLSSPPTSPPGPMGTARIIGKGVCALRTIAPPQCKIEPLPMTTAHETGSKHTSLLDLPQPRTPKGTLAPGPIATAKAVSSSPPHTPLGPMETARMINKGVRAKSAITSPQCEFAATTTPKTLETSGKLALHLDLIPHRTTGANGHMGRIATEGTVSSTPQEPSTTGAAPRRNAREIDKGVWADGSGTPPKCEYNNDPTQPRRKADDKLVPPIGRRLQPQIAAAKASWSKLAQLAADSKEQTAPKTPEELVPAKYHQFIDMFRKSNAQTSPPQRQYNFWVELTPGATTQAGRIIPLSPAENSALDKLNAVTVKNKYLLPLTMDLVDGLLDADTFTKLNLQNAYGNLRVAEGDKDKLAFICKAGQFAPLTMPFGPTGAPG